MKTSILFFAILLFPAVGHGQGYFDRVLKFYHTYVASDSMAAELTVDVYQSSGKSTPTYSTKASVYKSKGNYFSKMGETEMLLNNRYMVLIDHSAKEIVCSVRNDQTNINIAGEPIKSQIDSLMKRNKKLVMVDSTAERISYRADFDFGPISQVLVSFDPATDALTYVEYSYRNNMVAKIRFKRIEKKLEMADDLFNEERYLVVSGSRAVPNGRFKSYSVSYSSEGSQD